MKEFSLASLLNNGVFFRTFLLECSVREVRVAVATILEKTLDSALFHQEKVSNVKNHTAFIHCILVISIIC